MRLKRQRILDSSVVYIPKNPTFDVIKKALYDVMDIERGAGILLTYMWELLKRLLQRWSVRLRKIQVRAAMCSFALS